MKYVVSIYVNGEPYANYCDNKVFTSLQAIEEQIETIRQMPNVSVVEVEITGSTEI